MDAQTLYLNITAASMTLSPVEDPAALASIKLATHYGFDNNAQVKLVVTDEKSGATPTDPLNSLLFSISFIDKIDGGIITELRGRLYTGGGIEILEENYAGNFGYIKQKLDSSGAFDGENDFFESVETKYSASSAAAIKTALETIGAYNVIGDYRIKSATVDVPASEVTDLTPLEVRTKLVDMKERPRYIALCEVDSLSIIEATAEVMSKLNCHVLLDIGAITDWKAAAALVESISINDHRFWVFWNPNKSRPAGSASVLSRKKWRPCVGDLLAQLLLRNANTNASGIPPIARPVAGYDFPLNFRDMEKLAGVALDEEAQNALAKAGINVVMNERFEGGDRWVYGDALTQYDSETSALRLTNSAEIETFTTNGIIAIIKKHLLKGMSSFIEDATADCERFLDSCADAGLLMPSSELGGLYYALQITRRADNPFEKADVKFSRRPEGCARQVFLDTTVVR